MGTCIESVATATKRGHLHHRGAHYLIDTAATTCLRRAHREARQLDLLVNAGIYKDANAAEPALATIIQADIGANPGTSLATGHGTFAFDVLDGGCGVVTATRLVETLVGHGNAKHALIVAGDVDPSPRTSKRFPFAPAGGAMLITHAIGDTGFMAFEQRTFPEYADLFSVTLHWASRAGMLRRGRNIVEVTERPGFAARCAEIATEVTSGFLADHGIEAGGIDLLITSQYPRTFGHELGHRLGIPEGNIPRVPPELVSAHTAGPIAALEAAFESGQFFVAHRTLFVTVGGGLSVAVALYVDEAT